MRGIRTVGAAVIIALLAVHRLPASQVLLKVPFFPDRTDQCGPATLAEILGFWGLKGTPASLREEMYSAKLQGTLPVDLFLTAEAHGLKAEMIRGDRAALQSELLAGRPVLVMLDLGFAAVPVGHYVVVTGFDDARQGFYAHSAGKENQFIPYQKFLRAWQKADEWAMRAQSS